MKVPVSFIHLSLVHTVSFKFEAYKIFSYLLCFSIHTKTADLATKDHPFVFALHKGIHLKSIFLCAVVWMREELVFQKHCQIMVM